MIRRPKNVINKVETDPLPLKDCLAKTRDRNHKPKPGRDVLSHCSIVGEVAREIRKRMPEFVKNSLFSEEVMLVAACHDIGKVSPYFQAKIYKNLGKKNPSLQYIVDPNLESKWSGHAGVSQVTLSDLEVGKYIPEIVGQHHGFTPDLRLYNDVTKEIFGGPAWQNVRLELIAKLKERFGNDWPTVDNIYMMSAISGLTTVSDWIGSGASFDDPAGNWEVEIENAIDHAGLIRPDILPNLQFADIFRFKPRDAQLKFIEAVTRPGVYILEAPMGMGKTEAALFAAYQVLATWDATGIYFALPTQLTSDKIHVRVNNFLDKILAPDCASRDALLLHGMAWLRNTEMGEDATPGGSWFSSTKRRILAPFGVGTIDQALMAVMNVKHGFVRSFGLAGKVVILDEVHSYDAYTGTILDRLVSGLRALQCTVIILSATLTRSRRSELIDPNLVADNQFPLITAFPQDSLVPKQIAVRPDPDRIIKLSECTQEQAYSEALLRAELKQQVLWIENTVKKAQEVFRILASRADGMDIDCGILHSRFTIEDRDKLEQNWVDLFGNGKQGEANRAKKGRILVGTQVLEQSLDIDADFLITRFCPTDMMLQRIGRLWRHGHTARPDGACHEAWIMAPDLEQAKINPDKEFGSSAFVYSPYVLCRSLEIWTKRKSIAIPGDIRNLIENTYVYRSEEGSMAKWYKELHEGSNKRKGIKSLQGLARVGLAEGGTIISDNIVSTRYSERESIQVLLVKSINTSNSDVNLVLLNDKKLKIVKNKKDSTIATKLMRQITNVPRHQAPKPVSKESIRWLGNFVFLGTEEDERIRVGIVKPDDRITLPCGSGASDRFSLSYCGRLGYRAKKLN